MHLIKPIKIAAILIGVCSLALIAALVVFLAPLNVASAAISGQKARNDQKNVYYNFHFTGNWRWFRVYIDTDQNSTTGFPVNGVGAEYLLEGNNLYSYAGSQGSWNWHFIKQVTYSNVNGLAKWTVARVDIGETAFPKSTDLIFQTESSAGNIDTALKYTQHFTGSGSVTKLAVPSYFYPDDVNCATNCYWTELDNSAPTVGLALLNPNSGPGSFDVAYLNQTRTSQGKGIMILGYVHTSYGSRPLADIEAEVDQYYNWYGVDGIFFDEASADCNFVTPFYQPIFTYVKSKPGHHKVIINPGVRTPECFVNVADIIVNFEDVSANYASWTTGWETKYPSSHFWHIIYNTGATSLGDTLAKAKQRNAGWVYVTSETTPNPYGALPPYWNDEVNKLKH